MVVLLQQAEGPSSCDMSSPVAVRIYELLNSSQKSSNSHTRTAKRLWALQEEYPVAFMPVFLKCLKYAVGLTSVQVDRFMKFVGAFSQLLPIERQNQPLVLLERVVDALLQHVDVESKIERCRACAVVGAVVNRLPTDVQLSDVLHKKYTDALVRRLDDKCPKVRQEAVLALQRFSTPGATSLMETHVVQAIMGLLTTEKNQEVRRAILRTLPAVEEVIPLLLQHCRDESLEVRKAAYSAFQQMQFAALLSQSQRARLISTGLRDQVPEVQQSCKEMVKCWFQAGERNILQLMDYIGSLNHPGPAQHAMKILMDLGALSLLDLIADPPVPSLRQSESALLPPSIAFFWFIVCENLKGAASAKGAAAVAASGTQAEMVAAEARAHHDALEELVPEAEDLLRLISLHAAAGPAHRCSAQLLMRIAVGFAEWLDGCIRAASGNLVQELLKQDPWAEAAGSADHPHEWRLAGNGGGCSWERAVCDLAMKAYPEPALFANQMLQGLKALCVEWDLVHTPTTPPPQGDASDARDVRLAQCLAWLSCCTQCLRDASLVPIQEASTWIAAGLASPSPAARRQAVCALASWGMLAGAHTSHAFLHCSINLLKSLQDRGCPVQEMAVKGVCNVLVTHGAACTDTACMQLRDVHPQPTDNLVAANQPAPTASRALLVLLESLAVKAEAPPVGGKANIRKATSGDPMGIGEDTIRVATAVVTGLQKVLMYQYKWQDKEEAGTAKGLKDLEEQEVMLALLLLQWSPLAKAVPNLQPTTNCFWNVYASSSPVHQLKLCRVFVAATTHALQRPTAKGTLAPELVAFTTSLLLREPQDAIGGSADCPREEGLQTLLVDMCWILVLFSRSDVKTKTFLKPLAAAILKALVVLPIYDCNAEATQQLLATTAYMTQHIQDRLLAKDLAHWAARLAQVPGQEPAALAEEDVEALCDQHFQQPELRPFLTVVGHGGRASRAAAAPRPRRRTAAQAAAEDSSDEEPDVPAQPAQASNASRRRSTRAAAQAASQKFTVKPVISDEESDEESPASSDSEVVGERETVAAIGSCTRAIVRRRIHAREESSSPPAGRTVSALQQQLENLQV